MSCLAMLPSNSVLRNVNINDDSDNPGQNRNIEQDGVARVSSGLLRASAQSMNANAGLLESIMVAQEQQRRRALLLAATRVPMGAQSFLSSNDAAALLVAERQRALLLLGGGGLLGSGGGLFGGLRDQLSDLGSLGRLEALHRASTLGALTGAVGSAGGVRSTLMGTMGNEPRLPIGSETHTGGPPRPTSPITFLRTVRQQRGIRPADFPGDSIVLDAMERTGRKGRTGTFPQKLYKALADLEKEGRTDIAAWLPKGHAFVICDPKAFEEVVMKKYFRMNHFSSFQRQTNLYEYTRITEGPDKGAYFHELFHRGRPILASQIRRNKIKGDANSTGVKADSNRSPLMPSSRPTVDGIVSSFLKSKRGPSPVSGRDPSFVLASEDPSASEEELSTSNSC